jgi:uncharacterized membrane protein
VVVRGAIDRFAVGRMFGIKGLDSFGLVHTMLGFGALCLGLLAVLLPKGTPAHRRIGQGYAGTMILLNGTGLMIYDLSGRFGPFHIAALISLATIGAGFVPVYLRRPHGHRMEMHGMFMSWSFVGLLAALISEIATRVPGVQFGVGATIATVVVVGGGALVIHTRVPRIVERLSCQQRATTSPSV